MSGDARQEARQDLHDLLTSGSKLSKLRVLRVVCDHGRELAAVYRYRGRLLLIARTTSKGTIGDSEDDANLVWLKRGEGWRVAYFDLMSDDEIGDVSNGCCHRTLNAGWMRERIAEGRSRAVLPR